MTVPLVGRVPSAKVVLTTGVLEWTWLITIAVLDVVVVIAPVPDTVATGCSAFEDALVPWVAAGCCWLSAGRMEKLISPAPDGALSMLSGFSSPVLASGWLNGPLLF